jgi:DUF4097 and DUF4098 domain-containing protein YvlB
MRNTVLTLLTAAALTGHAAAQSPDERIRAVISSTMDAVRVVHYQRGYDRDREEQTERQTKTVRLGTNGELDVSNISGDIVISRGDGDTATIEILKRARGRTAEDARELLQLVQVDIAERNNRAEVRTRYPNSDERNRNNRRNFNVSVAYNITAPAGTRVTVKSISGNVKASEIKGDISAESVSGNIRLASAGRIASAKSVSGTIEISDTQVDGALQAGSVSGSVILRKVRAGRVSLDSVSGSVMMADLDCERVAAHSFSGDVQFAGPIAKNGRYELKSHSGEIRLAIDGTTGFELDANSFSGSLRSDLSLVTGGDAARGGRRRTLHGVYGDGSAMIDITTFSGSVVLTKR